MPNFDIVICVKALDSSLLALLLGQVRELIKPQNIIVITNIKNLNLDSKVIESIIILDENSIYDNLSLDSIKEIMLKRDGDIKRAGWYLQQFLKMGYARFVTKNKNILANNGGG